MADKKTALDPKARPAGPAPKAAKTYYIVNPHGAIHDVDRAHAKERLKLPGWRMATAAEVEELRTRGGEQRFDNPICAPWVPDPDLGPEIPAE